MYANYFGAQTVTQTNPNTKYRKRNVLYRSPQTMKFDVFWTCEKAMRIVRGMKQNTTVEIINSN